ncbi:LytTR family DNA-binding domain-containing protein [Brevibacillus formosus]|uniref:LytR/AlgR family response regulator transcription factor n=1 Tax=Brevibacillus TaxID=55080 RepID=UPI000D0FCF53|nr:MULTISPECIES: LytTR family DNA-binding domain-containing protein [Brevibacillus]MBG9943695.1 regulator [Brevibacillus formosus]MED1948265.1 LytTR family DNA-binding domain-containing protein [Brevibacillus formosus]MED1998004.1 LytTR family DNA-binding domain-containing protein [Brevibacillus formosus]MED2080545.1 LytTR family DNA-binding domain-containing protein [Brevibacillus formosus]PSK13736.1 DNA-binding response regulator [Brevibacillus sp. NRRL NRS-603]
MYRVAICDDEEKHREFVKSILITLSIKTNIEFVIESFDSGEQLVSYYERHEIPFHILILDIEMSGMNGIQTARTIRGLNNLDEQIIFLTSYPKYMMESFDVMTFQYLIKPIAPSILEEKIIKLHQYFQALDKKYMVIKSGYEEVVLKYDEIISIEAAKSLTIKSKLHFTTTNQTYESKGIISDYALALKDCNFIQIHRSIIINLLHVKKFASGVVLMSNGKELPIGRSKMKEVKDTYTKFMIMKVD